MADPDDDALSWAGDEDQTTARRPRPAAGSPVAPAATERGTAAEEIPSRTAAPSSGASAAGPSSTGTAGVVSPEVWPSRAESASAVPSDAVSSGAGPDAATPSAPAAGESRGQASSAVLISVGVIAGIYLLYTIGWYASATRVITVDGLNPVEAFMATLGGVFAVAAPALWAAAVSWLGRRRSIGWRLGLLAVGVVLLVPWPFVVQS
ncbi:hypothetical protein [Mycetocola reblochoni]|uniref:DNA polymerase III subunit gamma/tau n=2 Tax=Mycetocola reblochoni TaxID=331618 RepID=A0A1R4JA91_9MICO|nr:hypothetical protein [Mycetocola reblochoni]RLP70038.1 hypothetical protein D9V30_05060 [Mycetocola reblochoni]SJN29041.1 hypothetical protein FM119_06355 [Mycetocola reblochoni REB411]